MSGDGLIRLDHPWIRLAIACSPPARLKLIMAKELKRSTWYVSFEPKEQLPGPRGIVRRTETFRNEQGAKAFAKARLADSLNINAGTLNPHLPKRIIALAQILDWLDEPND
jgi:hypothetical protein